MDIKGFFFPTALSQLSTVKMGDVVSFSPLSGSPMLLVCLVVLLLTCRLDYGDVFSELNVWRQWETNKMIRVIGCGHLEKGGNEWNSERKGVFSWKGACVLVKVLLRVENFFLQWKYWKWPRMDCANGNSCYRIVVLITADSYSVVYVHYVTKIL